MGALGNNTTNSECKFAPPNNTTIDRCIVVVFTENSVVVFTENSVVVFTENCVVVFTENCVVVFTENSDYKHTHFACRAILEHKSHSTVLLTRQC